MYLGYSPCRGPARLPDRRRLCPVSGRRRGGFRQEGGPSSATRPRGPVSLSHSSRYVFPALPCRRSLAEPAALGTRAGPGLGALFRWEDNRRSWVGRILNADRPRHGGFLPGPRAPSAELRPAGAAARSSGERGVRGVLFGSLGTRALLPPAASFLAGTLPVVPAAAGRRSRAARRSPAGAGRRARRFLVLSRPSGGRGPGRGGPGPQCAFEVPMITAFCNSH